MLENVLTVEGQKNKPTSQVKGISKELKAKLANEGYHLKRLLSEDGKTRNAYEGIFEHKSGLGKNKVVLKVSKDTDSITAKINQNKRDINENEIKQSQSFNSQKITKVQNNFKIDGHDITIEPYNEGAMNLESYIKLRGNLNHDKEQFDDVGSQLIKIFKTFDRKGYLHRDIKPNNYVIDEDRNVMLLDLQNTEKKSEIKEGTIPTRGGADYTHPDLLNALILKTPNKSTTETELYSFSATLYTLLTGKKPFDYKLKSEEGNENFDPEKDIENLELFIEGEKSKYIGTKEHDKRVKKALKKAPRRSRKFLKKGLRYNTNYNIDELEKDFKTYAQESWFSKKIKKNILKGAIVLSVMLGAGYMSQTVAETYDQMQQTNLKTAEKIIYTNEISSTPKQQEFLKSLLANQSDELLEGLKENNIDFTKAMNDAHKYNIPKRELATMLRISAIADEKELSEIYSNEKRIYPFMIPESKIKDLPNNFKDYVHDGLDLGNNHIQEGQFIEIMGNHFSELNKRNDDVLEAIADYFIPKEEKLNALENQPLARTYFPTTDSVANIQQDGYAKNLDQNVKSLVEQASLLYLCTDNDGKVNYEELEGLTDNLKQQTSNAMYKGLMKKHLKY